MTKSRDVRSIQTKLIKASECMSEVFTRYEELSKENKELKKLLKQLFETADLYYCKNDLLKEIKRRI